MASREPHDCYETVLCGQQSHGTVMEECDDGRKSQAPALEIRDCGPNSDGWSSSDLGSSVGIHNARSGVKQEDNENNGDRLSHPHSLTPRSYLKQGVPPAGGAVNGSRHETATSGAQSHSPLGDFSLHSPPRISSMSSLAYDPGAHRIHHQRYQASRAKSVLDRLKSFRNSKRQSAYARLEESMHKECQPTGAFDGNQFNEEHDLGDGFNLSVFETSGGRNHSRRQEPQGSTSNVFDHGAVLAAEYHQLEAQGKLTGGLGAGLDNLFRKPSRHPQSVREPVHQNPSFLLRATPRHAAQQTAEKKGEIVAVQEIAMVDISNLAGDGAQGATDFERIILDATQEKSFYFPKDPDMPNWRPVSMHRAYICLLTVLALSLAGVQEYICLRSQKLAREGTGLLEFIHPQEISFVNYFAWKYAPIMLLLAYGVLWQTTDFEVKRLEPYYQLSRSTGALAAESLNVDYLTFWSYLTPFKAFRYKQWAVVCSAVGYLCAGSLVPILQSASVVLLPERAERRHGEPKFVRIHPVWSRLMETALLVVALCGILLLFQLRRKSGLLSDPNGIAGIAAMATRSHILNDFHGLDMEKNNVIHEQLQHRRYILHKSSLWQGEYVRNTPQDATYGGRKPENPHLLMLTLKAGIPYISFMLIFALLLPLLLFTNANVVTEKLPFLLTALATLVKLIWGTLECDVRMVEPFYILSKRRAPPKTLTLDYTGTVPGWIVIQSFINKHFLVCLVSLGAVLTKVLTVCASSFSVDGKRFFPGRGQEMRKGSFPSSSPASLLFKRLGAANGTKDQSEINSRYNSNETFLSFWVSVSLALGILIYLICVACIVYHRRRQKFLPRPPGTISSVLAFIHQSKMLWHFVDTERMDERQMRTRLEGLGRQPVDDGLGGGNLGDDIGKGKTYGLGWFRGRDGEDHLGVDEEPLSTNYVHGVDWRLGRLASAGGVNAWETYRP